MPWISKSLWSQHLAERERLLSMVERLTDHRARVERVEVGLSETAAPPRKLLPAMPTEVRDWIHSHQGDAIQERLRREANARARSDGGWDGVLVDLAKAKREEEG